MFKNIIGMNIFKVDYIQFKFIKKEITRLNNNEHGIQVLKYMVFKQKY